MRLYTIIFLFIATLLNAQVAIYNSGKMAGHYISYNGTPVLPIGDSVTQGWHETLQNFDYEGYIDALDAANVNLLMIWLYIGTSSGTQGSDSRIGYDSPELYPWDGSPDDNSFDLTSFDQAYFDSLKNFVAYAESKDILFLITIHDGWTKDRWGSHPFNDGEGNGPLANNGDYTDFDDFTKRYADSTYNAGWGTTAKNQYFQEKVVVELCNQLSDYDNVIYEMFNEGEWYDNTERLNHENLMLSLVKDSSDALTVTNTDAITGDDPHNNDDADIISRHPTPWTDRESEFRTGWDTSPVKPYWCTEPVPGYRGSNISLADIKKAIWQIGLTGAGFMAQNDPSFRWDPNAAMSADANCDSVYKFLGNCAAFINNYGVRFWNMEYDDNISTADGCMVDDGWEYIAFDLSGASFTVDLSNVKQDSLHYRWFNIDTGVWQDTSKVVGGSNETFTKPTSNEWALHVTDFPLNGSSRQVDIASSSQGGDIVYPSLDAYDGNELAWDTVNVYGTHNNTDNDSACFSSAVANLYFRGMEDTLVQVGKDTTDDLDNDKGYLVLDGPNCKVENLFFYGAQGPSENNAGIRSDMVAGDLEVNNCKFTFCENGILTGGDPEHITIRYCDFDRSGRPKDGFTHGAYIGAVDSLTYEYNYAHQTYIGHELKTRAEYGWIAYSKFHNLDGTSSYNIDISNGGEYYIVGCDFEQGAATDNNGGMIGWAQEGYGAGHDSIRYVVNCTFVNNSNQAGTEHAFAGSPSQNVDSVVNCIFDTTYFLEIDNISPTWVNIVVEDSANLYFEDRINAVFRLTTSSSLPIDSGLTTLTARGHVLIPSYEPYGSAERRPRINWSTIDVGCYEKRTYIGDRARLLEAGEWDTTTTSHYDEIQTLFNASGASGTHIGNYSDEANYNNTRLEVWFFQGDHNDYPEFFLFDEELDTFMIKTRPGWATDSQWHCYDRAAMNEDSSEFHVGEHVYDIVGDSWSEWSEPNYNSGGRGGEAWVRFIDLKGMIFNTSTDVWFRHDTTSTWEEVDTESLALGNIHHWIEYNPVHKRIFMGGGDSDFGGTPTEFWTLDTNKVLTQLTNIPTSDKGYPNTVVTTCPVSGVMFLFCNDRDYYTYDYSTRNWIQQSYSDVLFMNEDYGDRQWAFATLAVPMEKWGVILFIVNRDEEKVLVYKHAQLDAPTSFDYSDEEGNGNGGSSPAGPMKKGGTGVVKKGGTGKIVN